MTILGRDLFHSGQFFFFKGINSFIYAELGGNRSPLCMLRKKHYASLHPEPLNHFLAGISLPLLFSRLIWEGNVPVACLDKKKIPLTSVEYLKQICLCFPKAVEPVGWMDADA